MVLVAIVTSKADGDDGPHRARIPLYVILISILANLFYLEPETTKIMFKRHAVERRLETGHEVGQLKPKDPKKANDPELKALSRTFGMLHGFSTLMNLAALVFGCLWLSRCVGAILKDTTI